MNTHAKPSKLIKGATGDWEVIIGMEIHAQVMSRSKLFSGASTEFGSEPNSNVSLVDAAMPGMLPVINEECVAQAIRTGLGLKAQINLRSVFDRKNYFYPDLPQGYQISQYKSPIVGEGIVSVDVSPTEQIEVGIERLHLEQDAGKSLHDQSATESFVDLNRSGVALMEIVSKPDMRSSDEARAYVTKLRTILRYLGTCDGNMEQGSLRADVNVSVRRQGEPLGTRCEIKNVNSIRFIGQAIETEARRQIGILEDGGKINQETRLFDPSRGETRSMRSKEEAHDYRYFPDPDLLPLEFDQAYVDALAGYLPELPDAKKARFIESYGLPPYDAGVLVADKETADYFEAAVKQGGTNRDPKLVANWIMGDVSAYANSVGVPVSQAGITPVQVADIVDRISDGTISGKIAKDVLAIIIEENPKHLSIRPTPPMAGTAPTSVTVPLSPAVATAEAGDLSVSVNHIINARGMKQVTDTGAIAAAVDAIIAANPDKVAQAQAKPTMLGWFVGQVMKQTGGKANPQAVNELLKEKLGI
jgi:aspartyl-tRNA(Asn)/glutamyl-tRNA(Gln) amidotransferase subunit B